MNPADLDAAISSNTFSLDMLRAALKASGPVEAMVLMPLIQKAAEIVNTLEQLKTALREVQQ